MTHTKIAILAALVGGGLGALCLRGQDSEGDKMLTMTKDAAAARKATDKVETTTFALG